jgi:acyl-CoA thioester hydrolase
MNVMWYVGKFDEATWNLFHEVGLTPVYLRENLRGMAAVQQDITYKRELLPGDVITVVSELLEVGEKKLKFRHEMRALATGEVCAACTLTAVHMDTQARKSCVLPKSVADTARNLVQSGAGNGSSSPNLIP